MSPAGFPFFPEPPGVARTRYSGNRTVTVPELRRRHVRLPFNAVTCAVTAPSTACSTAIRPLCDLARVLVVDGRPSRTDNAPGNLTWGHAPGQRARQAPLPGRRIAEARGQQRPVTPRSQRRAARTAARRRRSRRPSRRSRPTTSPWTSACRRAPAAAGRGSSRQAFRGYAVLGVRPPPQRAGSPCPGARFPRKARDRSDPSRSLRQIPRHAATGLVTLRARPARKKSRGGTTEKLVGGNGCPGLLFLKKHYGSSVRFHGWLLPALALVAGLAAALLHDRWPAASGPSCAPPLLCGVMWQPTNGSGLPLMACGPGCPAGPPQ